MSLYGASKLLPLTRLSVETIPGHVDCRYKTTRDTLWVNPVEQNNRVDFRIASFGAHLQAVLLGSRGSGCVEPFTAASEVKYLCNEGQLDMAVDVMLQMEQQGAAASVSMYTSLLKLCAKRKALAQAKRVQAHLAKHGLESTTFLGAHVVSTFVKCGGLEDALQVFHRLPQRDVLSWTAMISGYTTFGRGQEALRLYERMRVEGVEPNAYTFVSLLRACGSLADLEESKRIHTEVLKYGCQSDLFVGNCLVDMYGKCGSIMDALTVFEALHQRDVVSWNAMLAAYARHGQPDKALQLYDQMQQERVSPSSRTFVSALQACGMLAEKDKDSGQTARMKFLGKGRAIHVDAQTRGHDSDVFVGNTLITMYGKCGSIVDAQQVFYGLSKRDVVSWNAMLAAYIDHGQAEKALKLYEQMEAEGISPDNRTFLSALQACGMFVEQEGNDTLDGRSVADICLEKGRAVHAHVQLKGYNSYAFVGNTLVSMYGKCRSIADAQDVFDGLSHRDVVAWTALLSAYVEQRQGQKVLQLYEQMQKEGVSPNDRTLVSALQACCMLAADEKYVMVDRLSTRVKPTLAKGKVLHCDVQRRAYESDVFVVSTLISMYGKCGSILDAQNVFDGFSQQDGVPWNAMLAALVDQGQAAKALQLYEDMLEAGVSPTNRPVMSVLQACGMLAEKQEVDSPSTKMTTALLNKGKCIHAGAGRKVYGSDVFVGNTLVSMYGKVGSIADARVVFDGLSQRDVVSWNAMLAAYVEQDQAFPALQLYEQMREENVSPDECTFVITLQACGMFAGNKEEDVSLDGLPIKVKCLEKGKALHADAQMRGYSPFVGNSLLTMYGKCGSIADAQKEFEGLGQRDNVVAWTAMLAAYVEQGHSDRALELYTEMQQEGVAPDEMTTVWVLQACSNSGSLGMLKQIHHTLVSSPENGRLSPFVASSLITAYGRCASTACAQAMLDALPEPDVVSWNALIACYARQGDCTASQQGYERMQMQGVQPDGITFLSLLSACSHSGLVDQGVEYFEAMSRDHGLAPEVEHYVCMVDLFGRAGCLARIEELLATMPVRPNLATWLCLLANCQKHGMVELGERAFQCATHLQPRHAAAYILMSNLYADAGLLEQAQALKEMREQGGAWKKPGQSWIEHEQRVHSFVVGDAKHPQHKQVYDLLNAAGLKLKQEFAPFVSPFHFSERYVNRVVS